MIVTDRAQLGNPIFYAHPSATSIATETDQHDIVLPPALYRAVWYEVVTGRRARIVAGVRSAGSAHHWYATPPALTPEPPHQRVELLATAPAVQDL